MISVSGDFEVVRRFLCCYIIVLRKPTFLVKIKFFIQNSCEYSRLVLIFQLFDTIC